MTSLSNFHLGDFRRVGGVDDGGVEQVREEGRRRALVRVAIDARGKADLQLFLERGRCGHGSLFTMLYYSSVMHQPFLGQIIVGTLLVKEGKVLQGVIYLASVPVKGRPLSVALRKSIGQYHQLFLLG